MVNSAGPQAIRIGGEASGICEEEEEVVNVVVVDMEILEVDVVEFVEITEEEKAALGRMILLLATGAGCVAIWPVTVLNPVVLSHGEVAMLALPAEDSHNPGKEAQGLVEEVVSCDLGASMYYMMRTGMNIPWTMQVNCTSPLILQKLLTKERLRWKMKIRQKTKKILRSCGR